MLTGRGETMKPATVVPGPGAYAATSQFGVVREDGGRVANSMGAPAFTMCDTDRWQGVQTTTQREGPGPAAADLRDQTAKGRAGGPQFGFGTAAQVRKAPCRPRSWANFSLL